jgi:hypothetical protein
MFFSDVARFCFYFCSQLLEEGAKVFFWQFFYLAIISPRENNKRLSQA